MCTDTASGRKTIRRLEILPQRPGRYVEPRVEYDPEVGRVDIVVRPLAPLPAGGVSLTCLPPPSADGEVRGRDTALLRPETPEVRLHLEVPPDAGPVFPFTIDVDEFARAFRYDVPTAAAARTVVTASRAVQVRIVEPAPEKCFGPEPKAIKVSLRVDIPYAVLRDGSSLLEIGVDADRDRTLQGEQSLQVTSDRRVELSLDPAVVDGSLGIAARISDLTVTLPPPPVRAGRANLLARAILPNQVVWSEPVEVVFDNEPPQLRQLQLAPGRSLAQGDSAGGLGSGVRRRTERSGPRRGRLRLGSSRRVHSANQAGSRGPPDRRPLADQPAHRTRESRRPHGADPAPPIVSAT